MSKKQKSANLPHKHKNPDAGRLPDGAWFTAVYSADRSEWVGTLKVPKAGEFSASKSGVFKLLIELDARYRASLPPPNDVAKSA